MPFHRKRSKFIPRIQPPFRYFLKPNEVAAALGITQSMLKRWRCKWITTGFQWGHGPQPVKFGPHTYRYRWDQVTSPEAGKDFLSRMTQQRLDSIAAEKRSPTVLSPTPRPIRTSKPFQYQETAHA
jgi:hypothetical protein